MLRIAAVVFDDLTPLDLVGPLEVLARAPNAEIVLVGQRGGESVRDPRTHLCIRAEASFSEIDSADVLIVPGGPGVKRLCDDDGVLDWIRRIHGSTRWTASVCTGALVLAAAGLLTGAPATTHWAYSDTLQRYGAMYRPVRYVEHGRIITAAGVSAGIDMSLALLAHLRGEQVAKAVQLSLEYDPHAPFDCGTPAKAGPRLVEVIRAAIAT